MFLATRMYADGPLWMGSGGLFAYHIQFSQWPTGEELRDTLELLDLIRGALLRHDNYGQRQFTGFDGIYGNYPFDSREGNTP